MGKVPKKTIFFQVFEIEKRKKLIRYSATKREWLHRLSQYTNPQQIQKRSTQSSIFNNGIASMLVCNSRSYIARQVQNCILHRNWSCAVQLLRVLLERNVRKKHLPFLIESIHTVLLNHPSSSAKLSDDFAIMTASLADLNRARRGLEDTNNVFHNNT